ncbi:hypothetical protein RI367_006456 [Sorochytrium milnesiophthora]
MTVPSELHSSVFQQSTPTVAPAEQTQERNGSQMQQARRSTSAPQSLTPGIAQTHHIVAVMVAMAVDGIIGGWSSSVANGWSSVAVSWLLATALFWLLCLSLAEMSCSLPFSGGAATFAQAAFGQGVSAFCALTFTFGYCTGFAWAANSFAGVLAILWNFPDDAFNMSPILWLCVMELFVLANLHTRAFFNIAVVLAVVCGIVLGVIILCSFAHLSMAQGSFYLSTSPLTLQAVMQSWPWVMGIYWGLEAHLPFYECVVLGKLTDTFHQNRRFRSLRKIMTAASALAICLTTGLMPTLDALTGSTQAVIDSFLYQLNVPSDSTLATNATCAMLLLFVTGWVHGTLYAASRHVYTLARAGYLPVALSHTRNGNPVNATLACATASYVMCVLVFYVMGNTGVNVFSILGQATTWLLCVSYALELLVFIRLRYKMPQLPRPWMSPVGVPGAAAGLVLACLGIFGPLCADPVTYGWLFFAYALAMGLFAIYYHYFAKARLRNSPEKEFITCSGFSKRNC